MRIVVVTQDDPYYLAAFFRAFFQRIVGEPIDVAGAVVLRPFNRSTAELAERMWHFYGPWSFLRRGCDYALRRAIMRIRGIEGDVTEMLAEHRVPVRHTADVNASDTVEQVRAWAPDAVLSVSAPQIFREALLGIPEKGCYNVHCGALPEYRGLMPVFWARYQGETRVGITLHRMGTDVDTGGIVLQRFTGVDPAETLDESIRRIKRESAGVVVEGLLNVANDEAEPWHPEREGSYYSFPDAETAREYRRTVGPLL